MTTGSLFHSPVLWYVSLRRKQLLSENPLQILTFHKSPKRAVTESTASEVFLTMNDNKRRTSTWYSNGFDNGQAEQDTTVQSVRMSACASDTTRAKDAVSRTTAARCRYSASRTKAGYPRPPSLLQLVVVASPNAGGGATEHTHVASCCCTVKPVQCPASQPQSAERRVPTA